MIAILGAGGQVGTACARLLGDEAVALAREQLDITHHGAISDWMTKHRPDLVINCAAFTNVDDAEARREQARDVNATSVGHLARSAVAAGARFVTFSTDYVFDGAKLAPYVESDKPAPLNVYGATKLEGEELALEADPDALVVRTSWVLSASPGSFAGKIVQRASQGPLDVVADQRGRPTIANDLAQATLRAVETGATGILHLTNQGETTWFDLATQIVEFAGFDPRLVNPISTEQSGRHAARPRYSVLTSERLEVLALTPMSHYQQGLEAAVSEIRSDLGAK